MTTPWQSSRPPRKHRRGALLQRSVQALSLALFLWLLILATFPLVSPLLPSNFFLRLDPLVALGVPLATRTWEGLLLPGIVVLLLALAVGRVFCGYICPMGSTLDGCTALGKKIWPHWGQAILPTPTESVLPRMRYLVLALLLTAAACGLNIFFWGAPIPLVTALYSLILHPLLLLAGKVGLVLAAVTPDNNFWGLTPDLSLVELKGRIYAPLWFSGFTLTGILALEALRPRFWCRFLCPAGALLSLLSFAPLWRRRVQNCNGCGHCQKHCPSGAIAAADSTLTNPRACITCRHCQDHCPRNAVTFTTRPSPTPALGSPSSRRSFLGTMGAVGAGTVLGLVSPEQRLPLPSNLLRPPGAVPEKDFLARCLRCGLCMKACPSNGLQPLWLGAGLTGVASPILVPQRGPCEPDCNVCGHVCPSRAITPLPPEQKLWAKMGTAVVTKERCVAWKEDKRCMVCQEVCPYGAVDLVRAEGKDIAAPPVPVVRKERCFGCGYCEFHCPVTRRAIVVDNGGALRLPLVNALNYREQGLAQGLDLEQGRHGTVEEAQLPESALPPGFTD